MVIEERCQVFTSLTNRECVQENKLQLLQKCFNRISKAT